MATFEYEISKDGKRTQGILNVVSLAAAGQELQKQGAVILRLEESKLTTPGKFKRSQFEYYLTHTFIRKVTIELAFEQFGILLKEGVPILNALELMQETSPFLLSRVFRSIRNRIQDGVSVHESVRLEASFLGEINRSLIEVGETNGSLPEMLTYASELMQQKRAIRSQIIEALIYPVIVVLMTCGVGYFLVSNVLPKVLKFINKGSGKLPAMTSLLIDISNFIQNQGHFVLYAFIILIVLFFIGRNITMFRYIMDWCLLRIPLLSKAMISYSNSLWCRTLGLLIQSGINITTALQLTENTMHNFVFKKQFKTIQNKLRQGYTISESFRATNLKRYAPIADRMILVGENSGSIDNGLINAANYNSTQLSRRVTFIGKFIEPAMFLIVGGMVGFVYIAFIMAIMAATRSVH